VTSPPAHHFFGYYEKSPWNGSEQYLLTHEVDFADRRPTREDQARVLLVDAETLSTETVATTRAWDFQQGAMLQWMPPEYENRILFNDRESGSFVGRLLNVETGEEETLSEPVYAVTPDGKGGFTLDFERLDHTRPGYGYAPLSDSPPDAVDPHPADDGVYAVDIESDTSELLVSLDELASFDPVASMEHGAHWVNHIQVDPTGRRVAFIHRSETPDDTRWYDRLFVMTADGSDLRLLAEEFVSHYDWRSPTELMAWTREPGSGEAFHLYDLEDGSVEPIAPDLLPEDGHNSFSPDGRWVLTDTYPDEERERHLMLYDFETGELHEVDSFYSPPVAESSLRCDLHPRWDREGAKVCFDSTHEDSRQMYVLDVSDYTR
jgi:hypothetical protein